MQALMLAAGMGKRLKEFTKDNTKCMVKVNGEMLIDRVVSLLSRLNVSRLVVVTGYKGEALRQHLESIRGDLEIEYVDNPEYYRTNNIYSLWLAKDKLQEEDTLLLESDLIYDYSLIEAIAHNSEPNLALVAKYETWMDGTMVQIDKDCNIVNFVPKKAFDYKYADTYYKTVNIYKFSKEFSINKYVPFLEAYIKAVGNNEYYENVLSIITFLNSSSLKALPVGEGKWYEIDDKLDLDIAELIFAGDGDFLDKLSARHGGLWRIPRMTDFCSPSNAFFSTSRITDELEANFRTLISSCPSGMQVEALCASKCRNVKEEFVVTGGGACELAEKLRQETGGKIGMIRRLPEAFGHVADDDVVYLPQEVNYTVADIKKFFTHHEVNAIMMSNPDRVTGGAMSRSEILELADWCEEKGMRLIVDESAADFCEVPVEHSVLEDEILEHHRNLVVINDIATAYGFAGMRLALLCSGNRQLVECIKKSYGLWSVNSVAEFFMQILGKYENDYARSCKMVRNERNFLEKELNENRLLKVIPSQANFVLCEVLKPATSGVLVFSVLKKHNILLRNCTAQMDIKGREFIKTAVKTHADNVKLVSALREVAELFK